MFDNLITLSLYNKTQILTFFLYIIGPATCVAFGDPHYRTFDGAAISFQGTCRYVLTADCSTQQFNILVENNDRGFNGVSWTHRVVVVLQNASVDLRAGPSVYVCINFFYIQNLFRLL